MPVMPVEFLLILILILVCWAYIFVALRSVSETGCLMFMALTIFCATVSIFLWMKFRSHSKACEAKESREVRRLAISFLVLAGVFLALGIGKLTFLKNGLAW